jgi:hypothetical protein
MIAANPVRLHFAGFNFVTGKQPGELEALSAGTDLYCT